MLENARTKLKIKEGDYGGSQLMQALMYVCTSQRMWWLGNKTWMHLEVGEHKVRSNTWRFITRHTCLSLIHGRIKLCILMHSCLSHISTRKWIARCIESRGAKKKKKKKKSKCI